MKFNTNNFNIKTPMVMGICNVTPDSFSDGGKNFVKKEYDILINLSDSTCIPIKYLVASSVARFKVGKHEENYNIYDLLYNL